MFFYISKIFNIIFDFYNLIILFFIIAIFIDFYKKKKINIFYILSLILIFITSILPTGHYVMSYLEKDFNNIILPKKLDGIIVLAGAIDPTLSNDYKTIEFNSSSERILKLLDFKNSPEIKKVFSGGGSNYF